MPNEENADPAPLSQLQKASGGFPHLPNAPWRRGDFFYEHRLNRIHDHQNRFFIADDLANRVGIGLADYDQFLTHSIKAQGPQFQLC